MRVKVIAKLPNAPETPVPDYAIRPSSFVISVGTHAALIAALWSVRFTAEPVPRPVYDEFIKPNQHRIVLYDFRKPVPDVNSAKRLGRAKQPQGAELSRQTIIASSPKPKSRQVFISVPMPKVQLPRDIPAPIVVVQVATVSAPPPPPRPEPPKPKRFVPPPPSQPPPKLPASTPVLDTQVPALSNPVANPAPATPRLTFSEVAAPKPKQFVAPPLAQPPPKLPASAPLLDTQVPALSNPVANPAPATPGLTFSDVAAPPQKAPEAVKPKAGDAKTDLAMASLHPAPSADPPVPEGERPGKFSKAPTQGEAASGEPNGRAALTVPDLTIRNPPLEAAPKIATEEIRYAERVRSVPVSTLSVPLRPSSRMIPAAMDALFKGRNVYTMVIPMEHIPAYTGDWILWFANRGPKVEETPLVRAPVPLRKREPVDQAPANARTRQRIQFSATLRKDGRLDGITLLTKTSAAIQHAVFQDVTAWEFQPATSDGVAVDVDVVLEIPFSLPLALASNSPQ